MGIRFRKSKKIGPFRLNVSKSGVGWSVGTKGMRYTKKAGGGTRKTLSVPGAGISYVKDSKKKSKSKPVTRQSPNNNYSGGNNMKEKITELWNRFKNWFNNQSKGKRTLLIILAVVLVSNCCCCSPLGWITGDGNTDTTSSEMSREMPIVSDAESEELATTPATTVTTTTSTTTTTVKPTATTEKTTTTPKATTTAKKTTTTTTKKPSTTTTKKVTTTTTKAPTTSKKTTTTTIKPTTKKTTAYSGDRYVDESTKVYWTPNGKSYHSSSNCSALSRSKTIKSGTLKQAKAAGKKDQCDKCW